MNHTLEEQKSFLINESHEDEISLGLVIAAANEASDADPASSRRERTLALLAWMLDRGFIPVDMHQGGPVPMTEQRPAAILAAIRAEWPEGDDMAEGSAGVSWWFHLPPDRR